MSANPWPQILHPVLRDARSYPRNREGRRPADSKVVVGKQSVRNELNVPPWRHIFQAIYRRKLLCQPFDALGHIRPIVVFALPKNRAIKRHSPGLLRVAREPQALEWNRKENNVAVARDSARVVPQRVE